MVLLGYCLLEIMHRQDFRPQRLGAVPLALGVGTEVCCTGCSALGPKLDRFSGGPSCSESGCHASGKAVAASIGFCKRAWQRLGFKSSSWNEDPSPLSFCGNPQGWRWGECTLFDAFAWIKISADQGIQTDSALFKNV